MDATVAKSSGSQEVTEGIYVYCIIVSPEARTFGKIGISPGPGGRTPFGSGDATNTPATPARQRQERG